MNNEQVNRYIRNQLSRAPSLLRTYAQDSQGRDYLRRTLFFKVERMIKDFLKGQNEIRMVGIPGLRGVGKTTLLAQLFLRFLSDFPKNILFISADQVVDELGSDLSTVFEEYEKLLGTGIEKLDSQTLIFIDEVHADEGWASTLKTIYDRSKKVFVVCTGSSALSLQSTTDLARRIIFQKMYPLSFSEYISLKKRYESMEKPFLDDLGDEIKDALFFSRSSKECFTALKSLQSRVQDYWRDIDSLEIDNYLRFGTMPYALAIEDEEKVHILSGQQIDKVVEKDLSDLGKFDTDTLSSIKNILLLVAGSSEISIHSLAKSLESISPTTIIKVLKVLERAEMLVRVYPYGSTYKKVRKPSKYYFMTPAIRHTLLTLVEGNSAFQNNKGMYLEDVVALTLHRDFVQKLKSPIFFDATEGGADFVVDLSNKKISIEVGYGNKGIKQAKQTLKKTKSDYGLVFSSSELGMKDDIVTVPLRYFLLI